MKSFVKRLAVMIILLLPHNLYANEPELLFSLSGDGPGDGFTADYAYGDPEPAYLNEYTIIPDGAQGKAFSAPHSEQKLMTYLAPGNIYAQRGTLSFFIRLRDPVGGMPFKLFYVSYCDHSSLDMTWLRVDYNGEQGFDAFVTDADMARVRVSYKPQTFPGPDEWTHIAFTWDETKGVRLYMNGELAAMTDTTSIFDAGLGLFQPFGRFATPGTVTSNCGHMRGGDIDEIRIYSSMLSASDIRLLASGEPVAAALPPVRTLDNPAYRSEWWFRYGWNHGAGDIPFPLDGSSYRIRKIAIHDAYDQKRWVWRSNDGIRETTWPNIYNRSRLPGRSDYFIEPDWYCYSTSGKSITYTLPDEPWNYFELTGAAYGTATLLKLNGESRTYDERELFRRPIGQERTFHMLGESFSGGQIRFDNDVQETPLAEFNVYHFDPGSEPEGRKKLSYTITDAEIPENYSLSELRDYIDKRFPPDERQIMMALPNRAPRQPKTSRVDNPLPVVHILIPFDFRDEGPRTSRGAYAGFHYTWDTIDGGLDGIAIDIPVLDVKPTHGDFFPLNIKVRDPLWPNRAMMDVSVSVRPGELKTLWLDMRDRILPDERSFYITIAGAGGDFGPDDLEGSRLRLVFKDRDEAVKEHEIDRFSQMRDNFGANMTETRPQRTKLEFLVRFTRDLRDLLKVNPNHARGREYVSYWNPEQGLTPFEQPEPQPGIPLWAFRQSELLKQWRYFLNWWIDNRQIENGELGGGLSDDGDFANCMPPFALMGVDNEKVTDSLHRLMEAYYENGMFTNGLNTILTDALHATEEGINVQAELMLLEYGDPKLMARIVETTTRMWDVTGVNAAGHRHFPSSFFSSTKMATENPWCWSSRYSYTVLAPAMTLVEFNGNPKAKRLIEEVADGILAHAKTDDNGNTVLPLEINYLTDEARSYSRGTASQMFRALYKWTGDKKYIRHLGTPSPQTKFHPVNKTRFEESYARTLHYNASRMYIATEGFPWDDSPYISFGSIVTDRLGGWPIRRANQYPEHFVSWKFEKPASGEDVAVLVPEPSSSSIRIIAFNVGKDPVRGKVIGWDVEPGTWEVSEGIDSNGDDMPDTDIRKRTVVFERSGEIPLTFPPRKTVVILLKHKKKGVPYHKRPDLGIGRDDVTVRGSTVTVKVHSLGSVVTPSGNVSILDSSGSEIVRAEIPGMNAPVDLTGVSCDVVLRLPSGAERNGLSVVVDPDNDIIEITEVNNVVALIGQKQ